ncbi:MAG: GNAT family protein [Pseudomonadota bacterium]
MRLRDGEELRLAPATAPACYALVPEVMDPGQMQYMHVPAYRHTGDAMRFLASLTDTSGPGQSWLLRVSDRVVGWVSVFNVQEDTAELGYFVGARHAGRGLATAAAHRITRLAHGELGFRRLSATTDPRNTASRRVLERCGFLHEGTQRSNFRYGDAWLDTALFGRLATDPVPPL